MGKEPGLIHGTVDVTNTGGRAGAEVVEAYVTQPSGNGEPPRQLCAFARVFLKPGETRQVRLTISPRSLSFYDASAHHWTLAAGTYRILVGTSSRSLPLHRDVTITDGTN
jgi:beta-glucosidase